MLESLVHAIGDSTIVEQGCEDLVHCIDHMIQTGTPAYPVFDLSPLEDEPEVEFFYVDPVDGEIPADGLADTDALILLGGGPWGSAGTRDLPTLAEEVELTRAWLEQGTPVIGIGVGAQILAIAAGGSSEATGLELESSQVTRIEDDALNGFLPESKVCAEIFAWCEQEAAKLMTA